MATHTLVAQAETQSSHGGPWYFGYEVFDVDGDFRLVIHTSTYDAGGRRDSHYASPEQPMESLTRDGALREAARTTAAYARAVLGGV